MNMTEMQGNTWSVPVALSSDMMNERNYLPGCVIVTGTGPYVIGNETR